MVIKDFAFQLKILPRAFVLSVLFAIAYIFFQENRGQAKKKLRSFLKKRWLAAFVFYIAFILTQTIFARQNTIPYIKLFENFGFRGDPNWDKEIIENIILFIPYTFFYLNAIPSKVPWKAALSLSVVTSALIEISQLVFWLGLFQLADLVHNTIGGILGCGIWYCVKWFCGKKTSQL